MKTRSKIFAALAMAGCLCLGLASSPSAQPGYYSGPCWGQQLSPEQINTAQKIFNDSAATTSATRQALAVKRAELDALLDSPNPDKARIATLAEEIGQLRGQMLAARVDVRQKLAQQGLPTDYYGTAGVNPDNGWRGGYYHHGGHRGGHRGGWGCGGMMW